MQRERTITWDDPTGNIRDAGAISGLDYLRGIKAGTVKPPPVAALVGYVISEVEHGFTVFTLAPGEHHYNPFATVHGGILSTLLDTTMTSAVLSTLPIGVACATIELKVNFVRPVTAVTGVLRCEARPIHLGKQLATAEGRVTDAGGKLYAHGVSTCSVFKAD